MRQRNYISQPALTKFLKNLEKNLGTELFRWTGHHMVPTEAGKLYLDFAKSVLLQKAELDEKIQSIADVQKSMRVGICFNTRQDILRIKFYAVNAIVFTLFDVQPNTCQPK